jgi:peptide-methionine (S)-S-oxide reductase
MQPHEKAAGDTPAALLPSGCKGFGLPGTGTLQKERHPGMIREKAPDHLTGVPVPSRSILLMLIMTLGAMLPAPAIAALPSPGPGPREQLTLGGGCFWCLDAVFRRTRGVVESVCGYAGGTLARPTYETVCRGGTGHIEVVRVTFETTRISREDLLRIFLGLHDPTSRDRQGADTGEQYRSVVFTRNPAQREATVRMIREWSREHPGRGPVVTEIRPFETFWMAEAYHQNYFAQHPDQPYCAFVVAPKVRKFVETMGDLAR